MNYELTNMSLRSAAVIVSSNKILNNQKEDQTSKYLIQELNNLTYNVEKVVIVPEQVNVICNELEFMVKNSDIIIAVGAKNTILYQAIGKIIGQKLQVDAELIEILKNDEETTFDDEEFLIPIQAKVMRGDAHPVVYFQRIFILKEEHFERSFNEILKKHLIQYRKERNFEKIVYVIQNGNANSDLNDLIEFKDESVKVDLKKDDKHFIFKISSSKLSSLVEFEKRLKIQFGSYYRNFIDNSDIWEMVYASHEQHIRNSFQYIDKCLEECGPKNVFISFNGGKDCTVLLHMVLTVFKIKYPNSTHPVFCLYVQSPNPFPEQDEFIALCQQYYNLEVMTIKSGIKDALKQTLSKYPHYKACFMGTRRTDPYSSDLAVFQMTDSDWPQILRVSPLLDWHYSDIWDYLLYYKVPYCKLYDMGFTSLGNISNTTRNPSLIYYDHFTGKEMYLPAYKLLKEVKERNGRNSS